jgi:Kef-type K+ transport system membrane component KefB
MKRHLLHKLWRVLKLVFICTVVLFIALFLVKSPLAYTKNQDYDIRTAILISIGFATSFRTMLCCRKKV